MKVCSKCGQGKPVGAFSRSERRCKVCVHAAYRQRREANPERERERGRKQTRRWREANRERAREIDREAQRKRRAANPEAYNENQREWRRANPERAREIGRRSHRKRDERYFAWLGEYKRSRGCLDCGVTEGLLHFDHRPGEIKLFNVAHGSGRAIDAVLAEIAKCDVRCASCHRQRHVAERTAA